MLGLAIHRTVRAVGSSTTLLVTVDPGEDPLKVSEFKRMFNTHPAVDRYEFTDAATVLARESESMNSDDRLALDLLPDNPYGDEFTLYIAEGYRTTDSLTALTSRLENLEGIDMVAGNAVAIGSANDNLSRIILALIILAVALMIISVVLINNTISLSIYSRRFSINTMKLVGATPAFIRRPFVRAGATTGAVGGLAAAIVVCGIESYARLYEPAIGQYLNWQDIIITGIALVLIGTIFARWAAWSATSRYLRRNYDQLFKK